MSNALTAAIAMAMAIAECEAQDVELVQPNDPRRTLVLDALEVVNTITGKGWSRAVAEQNITVTLPGVGPGVDLLRQIPYAGELLATIAEKSRHPMIFLSPAAVADGLELAGTLAHELFGHVPQIRAGGLGWCLAYLISSEARGVGEANAYGLTMAALVLLGGSTPADAKANVLSRLTGYGLDAPSLTIADEVLASWEASLAAGFLPEAITDVKAALVKAGWTP